MKSDMFIFHELKIKLLCAERYQTFNSKQKLIKTQKQYFRQHKILFLLKNKSCQDMILNIATITTKSNILKQTRNEIKQFEHNTR